MGEIAAQTATALKHKDVRYQAFMNYVPIPKLMDHFRTKKHIKGIFGGNQSTKTWAATFETIMIFTGIIPESMKGVYGHEETLLRITHGEFKRPRKTRIIVQSLKNFEDTIKPVLVGEGGLLPEAWSHWQDDVSMFIGPDGSFLEIMPIDPRERVTEKTGNTLRGAPIDHTQIDEITAEEAYKESVARTAARLDGPKSVTCAHCPQEGFNCWTFETFFKACYVMKGDLMVRKPEEDCHPDIYSISVSMKDNPSITAESYERQKRLYKPWEVAFRVDGMYSDRTSNAFFDTVVLMKWDKDERYEDGTPYVIVPTRVDSGAGIFQGVAGEVPEWQTQPGREHDEVVNPVWRIFEKPIDGHKYLLGADLAEGNEKSDPHSVQIWDATDQKKPYEVAHLHMVLIRPGDLAEQAAMAATWYGKCIMIPERNNTGGGMFLDRTRNYPNYYKKITFGKLSEMETPNLGFFTDRWVKGPMLSDSYRMLAEMSRLLDDDGKNWCPFKSYFMIQEFQSYEERVEKDIKGINQTIWGCKGGTHDDSVIAACLIMRMIKHEYAKISTCRISRNMVSRLNDKHYLGEQQPKQRRALSNFKKQPKLSTLRRNSPGGPLNARRSYR